VTAVFDTNVLIAAFMTEGVCSGLLSRARKQVFSLILCNDIIGEFKGVHIKKFKLSPVEVSEIIALVSEAASEILTYLNPVPTICRNQTDDMIIACAVDGTADYIVTGDEDLLILKKYKNIIIINPRNFESLFAD
jgi:putative PIN family toxin of toxin-antitoxin system